MVKEAIISDLDLLRDLGVVLVAVDVVEDAGLDPGAGVGLPGGRLNVGVLLAEPAAAARLALALVTLAAAPPTAQLRPRPLVPAARRARGAGAVIAGPSLGTAAEEHLYNYPLPRPSISATTDLQEVVPALSVLFWLHTSSPRPSAWPQSFSRALHPQYLVPFTCQSASPEQHHYYHSTHDEQKLK